jgi:DNA-binding PadR family transcriptional regulator
LTHLIPIAYYYNRSFFSVIPHKNELTIYHFDILLLLQSTPNIAADGIYKSLRKDWRTQWLGSIYKALDYLHSSGYVSKTGTKYQVTDKSLLLIAKVERKLQAILKEKGLLEVKPVGRPNRGGNMKEL